jgi:predicted nucleic acid-binding protein
VIFVDSSFWIAQQVARDARHRAAKELEAAHLSDRLITSDAVVAETWTYLRRKAGHASAFAWLDSVLAAPSSRLQP